MVFGTTVSALDQGLPTVSCESGAGLASPSAEMARGRTMVLS